MNAKGHHHLEASEATTNPVNTLLRHLRLGDKSRPAEMLTSAEYKFLQELRDAAVETVMADRRFVLSISEQDDAHRLVESDLYAALADLSARRRFSFPEKAGTPDWRELTVKTWAEAVFGLGFLDNAHK